MGTYQTLKEALEPEKAAARLLALKERLETAWPPPASLLKNKCEKDNLP